MHTWVLLHYKIPRDPGGPRVCVWRKLRRLGALLRHDTVWVLPALARTREEFHSLAVDINGHGGEAFVWEAYLTLAGQDEALVAQFLARVETEYRALLTDLRAPHPNLLMLNRRYQRVQEQDYFQSALGQRVHAAFLLIRRDQNP